MSTDTDNQMEQEIIAKGLTAPRITNDQITELMSEVEYHTYVVPGTTTTVAVAMRDGFTLCQEITACVDPANFDAELGKKYAIEKAAGVARNKLWELEGYKLKFLNSSLPVIGVAPLGSFAWALMRLTEGAKIARSGWNGSGMFAYLVNAGKYPAVSKAIKGEFPEDLVPYRKYLALKTAQNDVATWAPSGSDALANDWEEIK
jgi:hypothetical protein